MAEQDQPKIDRTPEQDEIPGQDQKNRTWSEIPEPAGDAPPGGQSFGERLGDNAPTEENLAEAMAADQDPEDEELTA
ncbi:hypothetical protein EPO04_02430 [Patescibacteria group bacterium]|nr:MAG: hypothetical protein EPO04_02430 [Patescibacteria group bacterium]